MRTWFCFLPRDRLCNSKSILCPSVRPSVCLQYVTLRYVSHTVWNTSKIISRPNSLRPMRLLTPTWAIGCNGNTLKIRVEWGWGDWGQEHIKAAKSRKRCKIGPRLLLRTNRNSHTRFRLVPTTCTEVEVEVQKSRRR